MFISLSGGSRGSEDIPKPGPLSLASWVGDGGELACSLLLEVPRSSFMVCLQWCFDDFQVGNHHEVIHYMAGSLSCAEQP